MTLEKTLLRPGRPGRPYEWKEKKKKTQTVTWNTELRSHSKRNKASKHNMFGRMNRATYKDNVEIICMYFEID